jgi:hypothetical protein
MFRSLNKALFTSTWTSPSTGPLHDGSYARSSTSQSLLDYPSRGPLSPCGRKLCLLTSPFSHFYSLLPSSLSAICVNVLLWFGKTSVDICLTHRRYEPGTALLHGGASALASRLRFCSPTPLSSRMMFLSRSLLCVSPFAEWNSFANIMVFA